jgi:hypothetical protein
MPRIRIAVLVVAVSLIVSGCREPSGPPMGPASQPKAEHLEKASPAPAQAAASPESRTGEGPKSVASPTTTGRIVVRVLRPSDPQSGWLTIEEVHKEGKPATAIGTVIGPRKLEVTTENVKSIRINLPKAGMPTNRRVILRIDHQGIEITGRYGPTARFTSTVNGNWSAARER